MRLIRKKAVIKALGRPPKRIEEFVGAASAGVRNVSIARMKSPAGWSEPGQTPDFDEYSVVLKGALKIKTRSGTALAKSGQSVMMPRGKWVQYSTPVKSEYISACIPAFTPAGAHRDENR